MTLECSLSTSSSSSPRSVIVTDSQDSPYTHSPNSQPNEQLRARELLRYYTPLSPLPPTPTSTTHSRTHTSFGDDSPGADAEDEMLPPHVPAEVTPIRSDVLKSSDDSALTAFSQLLALKLDCQRSMISLIDRKKQYIVAEATRTLSITDPMQKSGLVVPDGLWLGCETIPKEGGLCVNTVALYPNEKQSPTGKSDDEYSILEIQDLTLDPRFQDRDYVVNYPHLRFYAGTPLRTKRGYNIGSLCVVDSAPRVLTVDEKQTLGRMGKLVMRHLEMTADKRALRRNQRMAESLGRFVAGKDGPLDDDDADEGNGSCSRRNSDANEGLGGESASSSTGEAGTLEKTFWRASVLIRNALMADGVVFVDADKAYHMSSSSTARRSSALRAGLQRRRESGILGWSSSVGWHVESTEACSAAPVTDDNEATERKPGIGMIPSERAIQRLLELYPHGTVLSFDEEPTPPAIPYTSLPEVSTDEPIAEVPLAEDETERSWTFREVRDFLPGCAAVLFMPLLHVGGKPYAVSFSWTRDVQRVFTEDELLYMQGFMSSIMAEVSRLNTLSADKAKGDFISSISHELRSPLHGVLASVEFLAETTLDGFQKNFVDTVESCGRTLLDTINHVLDFSKLNSLMRDRGAGKVGGGAASEDGDALIMSQDEKIRRGKNGPSYGGMVSLIEAVDLNAITEQVVESVYAGYEFKGASSPTLDGSMTPSHRETGLLSNSSGLAMVRDHFRDTLEPVTVILDIDKRDDWTFVTQPGAVRRILMNLFGNALKYTDSGWVRIHLQADDHPPSDDATNERKSRVTFTVSDSGRGINREFLKTRLFTPFSQEDTLTSGTGLGMSIVRQIVQLLGGDIEVKSHVGVGTEVTVTLMLQRPHQLKVVEKDDGIEQPELSLVQQIYKLTVGKTICLCGLDLPLHESLARYIREWYGMQVIAGYLFTKAADVLLANESAELVQYLQRDSEVAEGTNTPVVVLCNSTSRHPVHMPQADRSKVYEFVSKPCGPIKLGKALKHCLEQSSKVDKPACILPSLPSSSTMVLDATLISETSIVQGTHIATSSLSNSLTSVTLETQLTSKPAEPTPNILIVEDNPINLMLLATFLRKRKYPFTQAENGLISVQAVQSKPENFDVILMDLQMPVMSGIEATRAIRDLEAKNLGTMKRSLIIALTGLAGTDNIDEAYDAGVDLFLTKPVSFKTVDRELEKWKEHMKTAIVVKDNPST